MDKIICPQCGEEFSKEFGATVASCPNCGINASPPNEKKAEVFKKTPPSSGLRSQLPIILAASFFTALFLFILLSLGVYWFLYPPPDFLSADQPLKSPDQIRTKPTPRVKKQSAIAASEITKVEFIESASKTRSSAAQYFGNVNPNNFLTRTSIISFDASGAANKTISESGTLNGVPVSPTPQKYIGAITQEKFAELAQVFVENDFLGEEDSKTSTSLPINNTLVVTYLSGEKKIQISNSGDDTPETEAMIKAFKNVENQVVWKSQ